MLLLIMLLNIIRFNVIKFSITKIFDKKKTKCSSLILISF